MTRTQTRPFAMTPLTYAHRAWFVTTAIGQWAFVYFIVAFYFTSTLQGNFQTWNTKPLIHGHIPNDVTGNLIFAIHVMLAAVMTAGGTLQLVPSLRTRAAPLHRWNGRIFLFTAGIIAAGGLYLVWVRGTYLSLWAAIAISFDAVLILTFGALALRRAMQRRFDEHRRWALRTFLAANAVWMLRVGYMFWMLAAGGLGTGKNMDGPFDIFWAFGCYLIPLAILDWNFRAQRSAASPASRLGVSVVLFASTAAMAVGIVGAYLFMWRPYI